MYAHFYATSEAVATVTGFLNFAENREMIEFREANLLALQATNEIFRKYFRRKVINLCRSRLLVTFERSVHNCREIISHAVTVIFYYRELFNVVPLKRNEKLILEMLYIEVCACMYLVGCAFLSWFLTCNKYIVHERQ